MRPAQTRPAPARSASVRWLCATLAVTLLLLCLFAVPTAYIDPLFHYHAPLEQYQYPLTEERYQNDGIVRHFTYDGIITGTSMTENFKTSEADALFDAHFIKVPLAGALHKEVDLMLRRAYTSGNEIRYVIRALDPERLILDKDAWRAGYDYPTYLYNDNPFDDVNYLFNKAIFFDYTLRVPEFTRAGSRTTTFDEYVNWNDDYTYATEVVLEPYTFVETPPAETPLTDAERTMVQETLQQNVIDLALEHPETTFYLYFSPFNIAYWGQLYNSGRISRQLDAEALAIEMLLEVPNIKLYSFHNDFDLICDLDNYKDYGHHGEWINTWILEQLCRDDYLLTQDNYQTYLDEVRQFYTTFDYPALNLEK